MKTRPLNNNVLIEVMRDDDGVSRTDESESMKYGRLVAVSVTGVHMTASSFGRFDRDPAYEAWSSRIGSIVRWEEYAEGGQTFEEDGKTFALIPWWRLIGYEETNKEEK